ncbi:MAG: hypothetical protein HOH74_15220, partial [Gemmatimonadetes bacterium]|nr:hypothetical protein [Gemmatimonadota bacterium]
MITDLNFWLLLAISVPVFWILPTRMRMGLLALSSFSYLMTLEPLGTAVLLGWSLCFYFFAPLSRRSPSLKWTLPALIVGAFGYLAYFKYVPRLIDAFADEPALQEFVIPIGISYFTFKLIHYAVEVKRDNLPAHSIQEFLSYIFLVPIFTA